MKQKITKYLVEMLGGGKQFFAFAYCFDNPPLRTLAAADVSAFQQPVDSSTISQGIQESPKLTALEKQPEDSPELTATEKIEKLKAQWLELLP